MRRISAEHLRIMLLLSSPRYQHLSFPEISERLGIEPLLTGSALSELESEGLVLGIRHRGSNHKVYSLTAIGKATLLGLCARSKKEIEINLKILKYKKMVG